MKRGSRVPAGFTLLVAGMALSVAAYGSDLFWFADGGWNLGGSGNWSVALDEWNPPKWSATRTPTPPDPPTSFGDMTAWDSSRTAVFAGEPGVVDITIDIDAGAGLRFETGPYFLIGAACLNLTGDSSAANSIDVADSVTAIIAAPVAGSFGVTKVGPGTLILSEANTYSGNTTMAAGTLQVGLDNALPASGQVVFAGGTLDTNSLSVSVGALSLESSSTLMLGVPASRPDVVFASAAPWVGGTLTVTGWGGADGTTYGRLLVTSDPTASGILAHIQFSDYAVGARWIAATGEVVPSAAAPTVTGISPASGPTAGGTSVTISGTSFTGATGVTIGGNAATGMSVVNATTITATTPAGTVGARDVVVATPGGTGSGTGLYTYRSVTTFSGPTATGTGIATASLSGGGAACSFVEGAAFVGASSVSVAAPVLFPHGLFRFTLRGCTGPVTMTITYPSALPVGAAYWKYGPPSKGAAPAWYLFLAAPPAATATYTLTLEDNRLGDDDWDTTTDIVDQGGPGIPPVPGKPIPTLGGAGLALLACLLAVTGLLVLRRMGC